MIEVVARRIAEADTRGALEAALDAWRERRAAELADLVEALGAKLAPPPLPRASTVVFHELWLIGLAADPVANLGPALATLTRLLPLGTTGRAMGESVLRSKYAPWLARLAALRPVEDPRIATALLGVLRDPPFLDTFPGEETVYDPVLDILESLGDVRLVAPLRAIAARPTAKRTWLREVQSTELRWLAESLEEQAVVPLASDERARIAELLAGLETKRTAPPTNDDELLALVVDAPDDDGPREVLADLWLERGDPRGELVALQMKGARGTATEPDMKRVRALLRAHEKEWLGPLATVTTKRRFERGFLDRIELAANSVASPETWARACEVPALRTVRFVEPGRANGLHYRSFVRAAPNLRAADADRAFFYTLARRAPPRLARLSLGFALGAKVVDTLATAFPALEELVVPVTAKNLAAQEQLAARLVARRPALRIRL